ncbi:MAG: DUF2934 domain-containing protein [Terriglobales bacterium]|jgi:hypothetical protein
MARKTSAKPTTTRRGKKAEMPLSPAVLQVSPEVSKEAARSGPVANRFSASVEEQIRRRAYELYLQRRATAGGTHGDENQDWLIAEREVLSGKQQSHSA